MNCNMCDFGTIQHTSFINEDRVSVTNVYGCNRCENGWSDVENPSHTVPKIETLLQKLHDLRVLRSSCEDSNGGEFRVHVPEKEFDEIMKLVGEMRVNRE